MFCVWPLVLLVLWWTADQVSDLRFGWSPCSGSHINHRNLLFELRTFWILKLRVYRSWPVLLLYNPKVFRLFHGDMACVPCVPRIVDGPERKAYRGDAAVCYVCSAMCYWINLTRIIWLEVFIPASVQITFIRDVTLCSLIFQTLFRNKLLHPQLLVPKLVIPVV